MKKTVNTIFAILMLGFFSSCNSDSGPLYYNDVPAIVHYENQQPMIKTAHGVFAAPDLLGAMLSEGDCLWTNFVVDYDNQPTAGVTTASDLRYTQIGSNVVTESATLVDTYTDPIDAAVVYSSVVGYTLFFGFEQQAPAGQTYTYEMIFRTDSLASDNKTPLLFIKSKKIDTPSGSNTAVVTRYAFDMTPFITYMKQKDPNIGAVDLYLNYYKPQQGNTEYKSFQSYPISWKLY